MVFDAYAPCPCGSGKKFKWCCQPIYGPINKAFEQEELGQHAAALRIMDELVAAHPSNPEAWGRRAELLYRNGKPDEAETALQKAFALNPQYAYGHFLRGLFRRDEGEWQGALLLFRKAAELFDPEAKDLLAYVWSLIADCEMKLNRPVASRAALKIALHCDPTDEALRQALGSFDDERSALPKSARREYTLQSPAASLPAERRANWDQVLIRAATGKLSDAATAFADLARSDPDHAAAWYNLGLVRAWLGDNRGALEALDHYVALETDAMRAAAAWALAEVLRFGAGMEEEADVLEYAVTYQITDPAPIQQWLQDCQDQRCLLVTEAAQDRPILTALVLERALSLTTDPANARPPRLGAYLLIAGDRLRLWHTRQESLDKVREQLLRRAGPTLLHERREVHVASFRDALVAALVFPVDSSDPEQQRHLVRQEWERYFEESWIHQPLRSLQGKPPLDAADHPLLKKKLAGVVQFLEESTAVAQQPYDFQRLRRKLGLLAAEPTASLNLDSLSAPELAQLEVDQLSDDQLEQAYQSALKSDAREVAGMFARALIARPPRAERPDRFPWYAYLMQLALSEGDTTGALNYLNEGEKDDCEHNQGRRRNDYELRRGQVYAKRGEAAEAQDVFDRLIARVPSELRYRSSAAEAMLSARQGSRALRFAEAGLAKAREQNNRDSEQHFLELVEAAQRQIQSHS